MESDLRDTAQIDGVEELKETGSPLLDEASSSSTGASVSSLVEGKLNVIVWAVFLTLSVT